MKRVWERAFLAALEQTGSVTQAAEAAKMGRSALYAHRRKDPVFARLWDESLDMAADVLEDEARRRAFAGSDVLLIFLLKAIRPQKYRESRATIPPAELNRLIEAELQRIAKEKALESAEPVN